MNNPDPGGVDRGRFDELKEAFVLGALPEEERRGFEEYLAAHPERQAEVEDLGAVAGLLALSPHEQDPPPGLRRAVMNVVSAEAQSPHRDARADRQHRGGSRLAGAGRFFGGSRGRGQSLALGAAALLLVGLFSWNLLLRGEAQELQGRVQDLQGQVEEASRAADARGTAENTTVALEGSGAARGTFAEVVALERDRVVLVADSMPELREGRTYQIWVIRGSDPRPSGLFEPGEELVTAPVTNPLVGADAVAVTVEPAGGSPAPTSDPVMTAEL